MYPNAVKEALEVFYEKDKKENPRLYVKMVGRCKKAYPLFSRNPITRQLQENPQLSQETKTYLGKSMFDQMNEYVKERNRTQKELQAKQKQKEEMEKTSVNMGQLRQELDSLRDQIKQTDDEMQDLEDKHGPLNKKEIQN